MEDLLPQESQESQESTEIPVEDLNSSSNLELGDKTPRKIKMPNVSFIPKEKILGLLINFLVPLLCLIGCGVAFFVFLYPAYQEIPSLESTLSTKTALSSQLNRKVSVLKELVDFSSQVEAYVQVTEKALISEPKVPELLAQIDNMSRESGMDVFSLNYSQSTSGDAPGMRFVDVALASSGSFESLVLFLKSVENASRLVVLKDFRYSYSDREGTRLVSASFQLQSPYLLVSSTAVTDEPIELSISSPEFLSDMEKILNLRQYGIGESSAVPSAPVSLPESASQSPLISVPETVPNPDLPSELPPMTPTEISPDLEPVPVSQENPL